MKLPNSKGNTNSEKNMHTKKSYMAGLTREENNLINRTSKGGKTFSNIINTLTQSLRQALDFNKTLMFLFVIIYKNN